MADTTDDDLIRRGDALEAVTDTSVKWGFTGEPAILIDTKAAIRALPAQVQPAPVAVTVKRLEWREVTNRKDRAMLWACPDAQVTYEITRHIDAHFSVTRFFRGDKAATSLGAYQTIEAAQAAAQADHSARILSAVNLRPVAEVQAEAVAGAVAHMREALRMLGVIPGKVWMMLEEIDSDAAQEALDRIRSEARAPLEAQIAARTAAFDRALAEASEATDGQAKALVRCVELTARAEAAEATVKLVKAHVQTQMRTADVHAHGCQCWRCAEDEMFAALAEIGGGNG